MVLQDDKDEHFLPVFKYEHNGNTYNFFIFYPISKFIFAVYSS